MKRQVNEAKAGMKKNGVVIPFPTPGPESDVKYRFAFKKPTKVFIAGSYLLKTITKTPEGINVDVAVQMPDVRLHNYT
jgi:U3 small nucleolar RNA-associated protein 22